MFHSWKGIHSQEGYSTFVRWVSPRMCLFERIQQKKKKKKGLIRIQEMGFQGPPFYIVKLKVETGLAMLLMAGAHIS